MHGYRGLTGACHTLYNDIVIGGLADNFILLFLDSGNDFPQHCLLVFGKVFGQQLIVCHHFAVVIIQQLSLFNLISPLQLQVNGNLSITGSGITAFSKTVFIIGIGHRGPPVHYSLMGGVYGYASLADIDALLLFQRFVIKVNSAEIGLRLCLLISLQCPLHLLVKRHAVFQQVNQFRIVIVEMVQHIINFFPHTSHPLAVDFQIVVDNGKGLLQKCFFLLSGGTVYFALFVLAH